MTEPEANHNFKARIIVTGVILGICCAVVCARAAHLMVIQGPMFREMARRQHQRVEKLIAKRGTITDRNGRVLAESVLADSLYAHPGIVTDPAATARVLAPILKESEDKLLEQIASDHDFVWLKRAIGPAQAAAIAPWLKAPRKGQPIVSGPTINYLPGIVMVPEYTRYYPEGGLAAHLLGFTGSDGSGLDGVEKQYEAELAGDEIIFLVERDARGRSIYPDPQVLPMSQKENRLALTIDARVQEIAERALDEAMASSSATVGMAAVMEVSTGKLLAIVNRPTFNPNDFARYPADNRRNRVVYDFFEPGSTFKSFTLAAMLDSGTAKIDDEFYCEDGAFEIDGTIISDTSFHGMFTIEEIIVHSSNIGAAKMGLKMGRELFSDYLKRFGFGQLTGIDMGAERAGLVRPAKRINHVELATMAFGQGIAVTGIQMLTAFNAIANKGLWKQPGVVNRIEDAGGKVITIPARSERQIMSPASAELETKVLINVVHGGGTGGRAAPAGYLAAGKTGTAQKVNLVEKTYYDKKYVASFLGYVPANRPAISILVVVDDPKGEPWGGTVAAPVFKKIAEQALPILGVFPEGSGQPINKIVSDIEKRERNILIAAAVLPAPVVQTAPVAPATKEACLACMPDLAGLTLRELLKTASHSGARVEITGSGRVVAQKPLPGTPVVAENRWWVRLAMDSY